MYSSSVLASEINIHFYKTKKIQIITKHKVKNTELEIGSPEVWQSLG